jgi:Fe-S oxidoreductase
MINLLNHAGISFGIIEDARCTGDPVKQMGDDYLFSQLAGANIELFNELQVKRIITLCPHCYNAFRHYYPPLGGNYHVIPHVSLLRDLIRQKRVRLAKNNERIAYHDPCYLGRHNGVLDEPRGIIRSVGTLVELSSNRKNSFCCGAGGGNYWNDEKGIRINQTRAKQAWDMLPDKVAVACPFCLLMLTDGLKAFSDKELILDIAELIDLSLTNQ